jgi:hypothetical protein
MESDRDIVQRGLILRGTVGSTAHGLHLGGIDDRDEMGVAIERPSRLIGLVPFEHHLLQASNVDHLGLASSGDLVPRSRRRRICGACRSTAAADRDRAPGAGRSGQPLGAGGQVPRGPMLHLGMLEVRDSPVDESVQSRTPVVASFEATMRP